MAVCVFVRMRVYERVWCYFAACSHHVFVTGRVYERGGGGRFVQVVTSWLLSWRGRRPGRSRCRRPLSKLCSDYCGMSACGGTCVCVVCVCLCSHMIVVFVWSCNVVSRTSATSSKYSRDFSTGTSRMLHAIATKTRKTRIKALARTRGTQAPYLWHVS